MAAAAAAAAAVAVAVAAGGAVAPARSSCSSCCGRMRPNTSERMRDTADAEGAGRAWSAEAPEDTTAGITS